MAATLIKMMIYFVLLLSGESFRTDFRGKFVRRWGGTEELQPCRNIFSPMFLPVATSSVVGDLIYSPSSIINFDLWRYFLAGGVCCAFSHGVTVPFDVIKTRIQIEAPDLSRNSGMVGYVQKLIENEGLVALTKGLAPTIAGYGIQGALKYGFYEIFKIAFSPVVQSWNFDITSIEGKLVVFALAGSFADVIGSITLSPFEFARIRIVSSSSTLSSGVLSGLLKIVRVEGLGALYAGLPSMLIRQVPYTTVQLAVFEGVTTQLYSYLMSLGKQVLSLSYSLGLPNRWLCVTVLLPIGLPFFCILFRHLAPLYHLSHQLMPRILIRYVRYGTRLL